MNAVEITAIVAASVLLFAGIVFGIVSYVVFYEVIARKAKYPGRWMPTQKEDDGDKSRKVPSRSPRGVAQ